MVEGTRCRRPRSASELARAAAPARGHDARFRGPRGGAWPAPSRFPACSPCGRGSARPRHGAVAGRANACTRRGLSLAPGPPPAAAPRVVVRPGPDAACGGRASFAPASPCVGAAGASRALPGAPADGHGAVCARFWGERCRDGRPRWLVFWACAMSSLGGRRAGGFDRRQPPSFPSTVPIPAEVRPRYVTCQRLALARGLGVIP